MWTILDIGRCLLVSNCELKNEGNENWYEEFWKYGNGNWEFGDWKLKLKFCVLGKLEFEYVYENLRVWNLRIWRWGLFGFSFFVKNLNFQRSKDYEL